jgi:hypothetical protein
VVIANLPIRGLRHFDPNVSQLELTLPETTGGDPKPVTE